MIFPRLPLLLSYYHGYLEGTFPHLTISLIAQVTILPPVTFIPRKVRQVKTDCQVYMLLSFSAARGRHTSRTELMYTIISTVFLYCLVDVASLCVCGKGEGERLRLVCERIRPSRSVHLLENWQKKWTELWSRAPRQTHTSKINVPELGRRSTLSLPWLNLSILHPPSFLLLERDKKSLISK